jgi:hypothetical protein
MAVRHVSDFGLTFVTRPFTHLLYVVPFNVSVLKMMSLLLNQNKKMLVFLNQILFRAPLGIMNSSK